MLKQPEHIHTFAVDADIVAYRCSAVCEESTVTTLFETLDEFLYNIARATKITKMTLFLSDKTNFRYTLAKTKPYKENRTRCKKLKGTFCIKGFPTSPECSKGNTDLVCYECIIDRPKHLPIANSYLKEMYNGLIIDNYEADDAIASYMTQHKGVAHAGIDKDIRQIQGWHYNFVKRIWEYTSEDESKLKLYRQICMGDTSDNIPGLPGIGEKKAEKAITKPDTAKEDAIKLYKKVMLGKKNDEALRDYFDEQSSLVTMVDTLVIPYEQYVIINPPPLFENKDDGSGYTGIDIKEKKPKLNLEEKSKVQFANSKEV